MSSESAGATLHLSSDEALVLFDWLARTSAGDVPAPFADRAEQRVLCKLECQLESVLVEPFSANYPAVLADARASVRD